jgi:hypothetical protein
LAQPILRRPNENRFLHQKTFVLKTSAMISTHSPQIRILLDGRGNRLYRPNETLAGSYSFENIEGDDILAVECAVLWYTMGKGSEDFGIHSFQRYSVEAGDWIDPRRAGRFSTRLPKSPLTYSGVLIRINWVVRVRVFLESGIEVVEDFPFRLGRLPDVRILKPVE